MRKYLTIISVTLFTSAFALNSTSSFSISDKETFESTHICQGCNFAGIGGFQLLKSFTNFENSILTKSDLSYSSLGCNGSWAKSNFDNTILIQTNFHYGCTMVDYASFNNANMQEASLQSNQANHASFKNTNLTNTKLNGSVFHYSDFTGAKLNGANLYYADFCNANITEEQIKSAANYACAMKPDCSGRYPYTDEKPCS